MDTRLGRLVTVGFALSVMVAGCSPALGSYEDCILEYVETGMDERAVSAVTQACRAKFPAGGAEFADSSEEPLDADALSRVTFRPFGVGGTNVMGVLHNGNPNITLTEVDVSFTTLFEGQSTTHIYRTRQLVPPYGTATLRLNVLAGDRDAPNNAEITAGRGRPQ